MSHHKIHYDATNNKEVIDMSAEKTIDEIKAEHGLTNAIQSIEITNSDYAHEVVNGVLQSFDLKTRLTDEAIAKEILRQQKEDSIKIVLGLTDQQFADLKIAMGL